MADPVYRPTPTQQENDRARLGEAILHHEPDGSPVLDPWAPIAQPKPATIKQEPPPVEVPSPDQTTVSETISEAEGEAEEGEASESVTRRRRRVTDPPRNI